MVASRSAVNLIVAASKAVDSVPERSCVRDRGEMVGRLGTVGGPFVVLLGSISPATSRAVHLSGRVATRCGIPMVPIDYVRLSRARVGEVLTRLLFRFPVHRVGISVPG